MEPPFKHPVFFTCFSNKYQASYSRSSSYSYSSSLSSKQDFGNQKYTQAETYSESGKVMQTVSDYFTTFHKTKKEGVSQEWSTSHTKFNSNGAAATTTKRAWTYETRGSAAKSTYKSQSTFYVTRSSQSPEQTEGEEYNTEIVNPWFETGTDYCYHYSKGTVRSWLSCSGRSTATSSVTHKTTTQGETGSEDTTINIIGTSTRTCKTRVWGIGTIERYSSDYLEHIPATDKNTIYGSKQIRNARLVQCAETNSPDISLIAESHTTIYDQGTHYLCGRIKFGEESLYLEDPDLRTKKSIRYITSIDDSSTARNADGINQDITRFETEFTRDAYQSADKDKKYTTLNQYNITKTKYSTKITAMDAQRQNYLDTVVYDGHSGYGGAGDFWFHYATNTPLVYINKQHVYYNPQTYELDIADTKFRAITSAKTTRFSTIIFPDSGTVSARTQDTSKTEEVKFIKEQNINAVGALNVHQVANGASTNYLAGVSIDTWMRDIRGVIKSDLGTGSIHYNLASLDGINGAFNVNQSDILPYPMEGGNMAYNYYHKPNPGAYITPSFNKEEINFYIGARTYTKTGKDESGEENVITASERIGSSNNFFPHYDGPNQISASEFYKRTSISYKLEADTKDVTGSKSFWNVYTNENQFEEATFSYDNQLSRWDIRGSKSAKTGTDIDSTQFCKPEDLTEKIFEDIKGVEIDPLLIRNNVSNFIERSNHGVSRAFGFGDYFFIHYDYYYYLGGHAILTAQEEMDRTQIGGIDAEGSGYTYHLYPKFGQETVVTLHNQTDTQVLNLANTGETFSNENVYIVSEERNLIKSIVTTDEVGVKFNFIPGNLDTGHNFLGRVYFGNWFYNDGHRYGYWNIDNITYHGASPYYLRFDDGPYVRVNAHANTEDPNIEIPEEFLPLGALTTTYTHTEYNGKKRLYLATVCVTKQGETGENSQKPQYGNYTEYIKSLQKDLVSATWAK